MAEQALLGKSIAEISAYVQLPLAYVQEFFDKGSIKQVVIDARDRLESELFKEKIPALKKLVSMGLEILVKSLEEINKNEELRKTMVKSMKDIKDLEQIVSGVNGHLRLEEGKSTMNLETKSSNYQETRVALMELAKQDPVFEYPKLPAPSNGSQ